MTAVRRHNLVVALVAALLGAGLGVDAAQNGLVLGSFVGPLVVVLGILLLIVLLVAPAASSATTSPIATAMDEAGWAEFRREMRRARRGVRSLTLVRIPSSSASLAGAAPDLATWSRQLSQHMRLVDRAWVDDGSLYVLLPESPRAAADVLLERVRSAAPGLLSSDLRVATFPDDGLTSGAIIAAVHGAAVGDVPIPIRTTLVGDTEGTAYRIADDLSIGGIAAQ
jgi:hypothetical protein